MKFEVGKQKTCNVVLKSDIDGVHIALYDGIDYYYIFTFIDGDPPQILSHPLPEHLGFKLNKDGLPKLLTESTKRLIS